MRNVMRLIGAMLLFCVASCREQSTEVKTGSGSQSAAVKVIVVQPGEMKNSITANGSLMANEEVELRSEIPGRIVQINFQEGTFVQKGQLLVKIDDSELQAQLKKTTLNIELAETEEGRRKQLLAVNGISREEYDASLNQLLQYEAEKQYLESQIAKTEIVAPFDGVVGLRYASAGGFVTSSNLIAVLQQTNPMKVEFSIPEKYASAISKGTELEFTIEGNVHQFTARVYAVESKIDPTTRTVKIRALSANPTGELIPGAFAKLSIDLGVHKEALVIPSEAIIPGITGQTLMIIQNGKAVVKPVKIGIRNETSVEITDGLVRGDSVIISGLLTVREGMPVRVMQSSSAE